MSPSVPIQANETNLKSTDHVVRKLETQIAVVLVATALVHAGLLVSTTDGGRNVTLPARGKIYKNKLSLMLDKLSATTPICCTFSRVRCIYFRTEFLTLNFPQEFAIYSSRSFNVNTSTTYVDFR